MNFVKYQKILRPLLDNLAGLYCYSPIQKDKTFKIGMSEKGIHQRLKQHKSCYPFPSEYWLQLVVIADVKHTRKLETAILDETKSMSTISVEETKEQGNRPREYRLFGNRSKVNFAFEKVLNRKENRGLWQKVVVFSPNGWHVIKNSMLPKPISSSSQLSQKSVRYEKRPPLDEVEVLPYEKTEIEWTGKEKVGEKIKTKWGTMTITKIISKKKIQGKWHGYDGEWILKL